MRQADKYAWRVIAIAMMLSALALACFATPVKAQRFAVVATCGTLTQATPAVGSAGIVTMDQNGVLCTSSTGSGGGAVTIADGAAVTLGTTTDAACATDNGTCTAVQLLKRENQRLTTLITNLGTANANGQATMANSSPVTIASNQTSVPVLNGGGSSYETIAASQTGQTMGPTGATGDYLSHCVVYPTSTSPGVLTVFDNTSSATNNAIAFAGGATSLSNLVPFAIPVGAVSLNGPWKVTTGANMVATCYGKFT